MLVVSRIMNTSAYDLAQRESDINHHKDYRQEEYEVGDFII